MTLSANVLDAIGGTPLVQLRKVIPAGAARVLVKLEGANPTGNMKDRMARFAIEAAERDAFERGDLAADRHSGAQTLKQARGFP